MINYTRLRIIANATVMLNKGTDVEYSGLKIHIFCKSIPTDYLHGLWTVLCFFSVSILFVIFPYRAVDKTFSVIRSYVKYFEFLFFISPQ